MKKFYLIIVLFFFTGSTQAQTRAESGFSPFDKTKIIRFFPNPATTVINFEFTKAEEKVSNYTLQVYTFVGKKVLEINSVNQKTVVPLSDFFRGVYIFQLRDKSGRIIESGKFQVNK